MGATNSIAGPRPHATVTIETIDRELAGGFRSLRFSPELEHTFEEHQQDYRMVYTTYCAAIGMVIYNGFLIADWQMLPDVFVESCIFRLGIVTPLAAVALFVRLRCKSFQLREALVSVMGVVCVAFMMKVVADSRSAYVPSYSYGTILVMIFSVLLQRAPIRHVGPACVAMLALQMIGLNASPLIDHQLLVSNAIFFTSGSVLLLCAAYALERESRHSYLLAFRSRLLNEQLALISKVDPLTGLWNRRHLEAVMSSAWAETIPRPMAVILLDIDKFKPYNDNYGHTAGDLCLKRIASSITTSLEGITAYAVRFGGEEFLVFLPGLDERAAFAIAERLGDAIRQEAVPHPVLRKGAIVSASFGVAAGKTLSIAPTMLIALADKALYRAKAEGRDCIRAVSGERPDFHSGGLSGNGLQCLAVAS